VIVLKTDRGVCRFFVWLTNTHFGQKVNFVSNEQTTVERVVIPADAGIQVFAVAPLCTEDSGYRPDPSADGLSLSNGPA